MGTRLRGLGLGLEDEGGDGGAFLCFTEGTRAWGWRSDGLGEWNDYWSEMETRSIVVCACVKGREQGAFKVRRDEDDRI